MPSLKFTHVEIDGTPEACAEVIRVALGGTLRASAAAASPTLPADSPSALLAAPEAASPAPVRRKKTGRPRGRRPAKAAAPEMPIAHPEELSLPKRVLAMIQKGPARTTGELFDELRRQGFKGTSGAVYQACKHWRDKGLVVGRPDDSDEGGGVMKQYPVKS